MRKKNLQIKCLLLTILIFKCESPFCFFNLSIFHGDPTCKMDSMFNPLHSKKFHLTDEKKKSPNKMPSTNNLDFQMRISLLFFQSFIFPRRSNMENGFNVQPIGLKKIPSH